MRIKIFIIIIIIFSADIFAEDVKYDIPGELIIFKKTDDFNTINTRIYFIGWSKDGKIAYICIPPDEARGYNDYILIIQNMISDKIEFEYLLNKPDPSGLDYENMNFDRLWEKHKDICIKELKRHNIVQMKTKELNSFPIIFNNDAVQFKLDTTENNDKDNYYYNITHYDLMIESKKNGIKMIDQADIKALSVQIEGYIKSPFEDRTAVFLSQVICGWEGPPHPVYIKIIGCHLTKGFKKINIH